MIHTKDLSILYSSIFLFGQRLYAKDIHTSVWTMWETELNGIVRNQMSNSFSNSDIASFLFFTRWPRKGKSGRLTRGTTTASRKYITTQSYQSTWCFGVFLWGGSKGVIKFPWIFFFMQCGVKSLLGTSGIYPGTYSLGLFAGLFSDAMGYCLPVL